MNCNNCNIFKERFGRNIRINNPIERTDGCENSENCMINKILYSAEHDKCYVTHMVPVDSPTYEKELNAMAIGYALDVYDLDSELSIIADEHDKWLEEVSKAIENGPINDSKIPF